MGEIKLKIHSNTSQWTEIWTGWDRGKDPFRHQSVNWNMNWVRSRQRFIQTPVSDLKYELGEIKAKIHSNTGQWTEIWRGWDRGKDLFKQQSVNWNMIWVRSRLRSIWTLVSELKQKLGEIKVNIYLNTGKWTEIGTRWVTQTQVDKLKFELKESLLLLKGIGVDWLGGERGVFMFCCQ